MKLTSHVRDLNARTRLFENCTGLTGGGALNLDGIPTRATGTITFSINPSAGATITLNGTVWTFVTSGASGTQTNISGVSLAATLTQLAIDLNASVDAQVSKCSYTASATVLTIAYKNGTSTANDFTIAASVATVSGPNLVGGLDYGNASTGGVLCPIIVADTFTYYRLRSGTDSEASPAIIRPDDSLADPTNHPRVWELMALATGAAPAGAAGGGLGGTYPNPDVLTATKSFALAGVISPAQITANTNDYAPTGLATAIVLRLNTDAARNLTGLTGGATGRLIVIENVGSFNITFVNLSGLSSAANQFSMIFDLALLPNQSIAFIYDGTSTKWRPVDARGILQDNGLTVGIGTAPTAAYMLKVTGKQLISFTANTSEYGLDLVAASSLASALLMRLAIGGLTNGFQLGQDAASLPYLLWEGGGARFGTGAAQCPDGVVNVVTGFRIGGAAALNKILMGNGTNFVSSDPSFTTRVLATNIEETQSALTYSATPVVDMTGDAIKIITMTGNLTSMTTSNRAAGRKVTVILDPNGSTRTLTAFNASWRNFSGAALPGTLASGKYFVFTLQCTDTNETGVMIAGQTQQ